jgi:hypothetical protein
MTVTGISTNDFAQILADFTRTVSYKVLTKTTNSLTGDETSTFAAAADQSVVFFRQDCRYLFDKEGLLQVADAYILATTTVGIKRYDQFTVDGSTYYIENVIRRYVLGVAMMDYGTCFLVT